MGHSMECPAGIRGTEIKFMLNISTIEHMDEKSYTIEEEVSGTTCQST